MAKTARKKKKIELPEELTSEEAVSEEEIIDAPVKAKDERKPKTKEEIKVYLKARGHTARDVDREVDSKSIVLSLQALHRITAEEYARVRQ